MTQPVFGIVTLVDPAAQLRLEAWQRSLHRECGLRALELPPHLTWQVATGYDWSQLKQALESFVAQEKPFYLQTEGLGIFSGPAPVIYLPVVSNRALVDFHARLWGATVACATEPSPLYQPNSWVPHITLAVDLEAPDRLGCILQSLAFQKLHIDILVDHLVLGNQAVRDMDQSLMKVALVG